MSCLHDEILSAAADGELDPAAAAHLARCQRCASRLASFQALDEALRELPVAKEDAPSSLRATLRGLSAALASADSAAISAAQEEPPLHSRPRRLLRPALGLLAACAAVAVLVVAPVTGSPTMALAEDAANNHLNALSTGDGSGCQVESPDPGLLAAWIRESLGYEVEIPRLAGATLVGVRSCSLLGEEMAAVVYRTGDTSFSLYLPPQGSAAAEACGGTSRCVERNGQTVCVLPDPGGAHWLMVGGLPSQELCSTAVSG